MVRFCYICVTDFGRPDTVNLSKLDVKEDIWTGLEVNVSIMSCKSTTRVLKLL